MGILWFCNCSSNDALGSRVEEVEPNRLLKRSVSQSVNSNHVSTGWSLGIMACDFPRFTSFQ